MLGNTLDEGPLDGYVGSSKFGLHGWRVGAWATDTWAVL